MGLGEKRRRGGTGEGNELGCILSSRVSVQKDRERKFIRTETESEELFVALVASSVVSLGSRRGKNLRGPLAEVGFPGAGRACSAGAHLGS